MELLIAFLAIVLFDTLWKANIYTLLTYIYDSDESLKMAIANNNVFLVKQICNLGNCSQDGYDKALKYAAQFGNLDVIKCLLESGECTQDGYDKALKYAAAKGHLDIIKYLLKSGKRPQDAVKKVLFTKNDNSKEQFNYIKIKEELIKNNYLDKNLLEGLISKEDVKELSEKYKAQQEWRIKEDCMLMNNLNKVFNGKIIITNTIQHQLISKIIGIKGLILYKLIGYMSWDDYLKVVKAKIGAPKKQQAIEEDKEGEEDDKNKEEKKNMVPGKDACKGPDEKKNNDYNDENDKPGGQGGGNIQGNVKSQDHQQDKDCTFYINEDGKKIHKMEESMEQPMNEKAMEVIMDNEPKEEISIKVIDCPVLLMSKDNTTDIEGILPMLFTKSSEGIGMGVAMHMPNLENNEELNQYIDNTENYVEQQVVQYQE